jgi:hypothetical protein
MKQGISGKLWRTFSTISGEKVLSIVLKRILQWIIEFQKFELNANWVDHDSLGILLSIHFRDFLQWKASSYRAAKGSANRKAQVLREAWRGGRFITERGQTRQEHRLSIVWFDHLSQWIGLALIPMTFGEGTSRKTRDDSWIFTQDQSHSFVPVWELSNRNITIIILYGGSYCNNSHSFSACLISAYATVKFQIDFWAWATAAPFDELKSVKAASDQTIDRIIWNLGKNYSVENENRLKKWMTR